MNRESPWVLALALASLPVGAGAAPPVGATVELDDLAVKVTASENRAVSFTNKQSAYYYTQTHRNDHPEHAWFRGLNIAGRRVFNDYQLSIDGVALDPMTAPGHRQAGCAGSKPSERRDRDAATVRWPRRRRR